MLDNGKGERTMKNIIILLSFVIMISLAGLLHVKANEESTEMEIVYITDDMTWEQATEIIENRNGKTVIEVVVGVVEDDNGNGHTIETVRNQYIKYNEEKFTRGDEVLSIFVYNPNNNIWDDIIDRQDFLIYDEPESEISLHDIATLVSNKDIGLDEIYDYAMENGYVWDNPDQMVEELVRMGKLYYIPAYNGNAEDYTIKGTIAYENAIENGIIK
jgi:hypothetical protein